MRLTLAILLALAFAVASWFLMSGLQVAEGPVDAPRTVLPEESHAPVPLPANADHTEADRVDATPGQEQVAEAAQDQRRSPDQSRVQSLLRKYGFESTDVPLAESQITELMTVSKTLDGEVVILGNRIGELSLPLRDKIFASKESLSVALQMGIVRRVEKMGDGAGPVRQPGAVNQIFYRTSAVDGEHRTYAGWICEDDSPAIAEALRSREALRGQIRDSIARIAGSSVRLSGQRK